MWKQQQLNQNKYVQEIYGIFTNEKCTIRLYQPEAVIKVQT